MRLRRRVRAIRVCAVGIGDSASDIVPKAIGELHDVGFGDGRYRTAAVVNGIFEGVIGDAGSTFDGDWFDADTGGFGAGGDFLSAGDSINLADELFGDGFAGFEFDTGVEVFGVFADDYEVDVAGFEEGADTFVGFAGANAGVQTEFLAEKDVDAAEAFTDGSGDRGFECDAIGANGFEHAFGDFAFGFDDFDTAFLDVPIDFDTSGFDTFAGCFGDFGADTITGEQSDLMHWGSLAKRVMRWAGIPACTAGGERESIAEFGADGNIWGGRNCMRRSQGTVVVVWEGVCDSGNTDVGFLTAYSAPVSFWFMLGDSLAGCWEAIPRFHKLPPRS